MAQVLARHVVCVLGDWKDLDPVAAVVGRAGADRFTLDLEYSSLEPDDRMSEAFEACWDRVTPSFSDEDREAIERHTAVAYVLSPPLEPEHALCTSLEMLQLVAALLEAGGLAAKSESAGIAHGRARWLELAAAAASESPLERASALHSAWVRRPIADEEFYYSCGMHLLGEADVEIAIEAGLPEHEVIAWMDALALYVLTEKPARGVQAGERFGLTPDGERRVLGRTPCLRYEEDDFFYNPAGYYRL